MSKRKTKELLLKLERLSDLLFYSHQVAQCRARDLTYTLLLASSSDTFQRGLCLCIVVVEKARSQHTTEKGILAIRSRSHLKLVE